MHDCRIISPMFLSISEWREDRAKSSVSSVLGKPMKFQLKVSISTPCMSARLNKWYTEQSINFSFLCLTSLLITTSS